MLVDVIEDALALLCTKYVFPEKAAAAAAAIRAQADGQSDHRSAMDRLQPIAAK